MPRINWIDKAKENLLGAVCTALVGMCLAGITMLYHHDKKIDMLNYKVSIILHKIAPELEPGLEPVRIPPPSMPAPTADIALPTKEGLSLTTHN